MVEALRAVGISKGDVIFSHVSLLSLGLSQHDVVETFIGALKEVIGEQGSFLTPAYSYSFCKGDSYSPKATKSEVGALSNSLVFKYKMERSIDPLFSVVGFGPHLGELFNELPTSSFGSDCIYERLLKLDAKICNFGLSFFYFTPIHYLENKLEVPYRFNKLFSGDLVLDDRRVPLTWEYYVRHLFEGSIPNCQLLHDLSVKRKVTSEAKLGLGSIYTASLRGLYQLASNLIEQDTWCLVNGTEESFLRFIQRQ